MAGVSSFKRAITLVLLILVGLSWAGGAFTIDKVLDNGTRDDPSDDLEDAARWTNKAGSFVEDGIRGLGGGLEYAIAQDFFDKILPAFVDQVRPTKAQLLEAIRRAFDRWAEGSPLRFVDVSERVFALRDLGGPGSGAEIDLLAVPGGDLAFRHTTLAANTSLTLKKEKPIGTNGRELPGRTITSADILFNTDALYYFDPNDPEVQRLQSNGWVLMHFESLLLHEIGHALGLDHPDEYPERNFDTDADPSTPMVIDCQYPLQGVQLSPNVDENAVMIARGSGSFRLNLSYDDLGGRNFLYPPCGISSPTPSPPAASSLQQFDENGNCVIDDPEFFEIIDAWIAGAVDDPLFFDAIDAWVTEKNVCPTAATAHADIRGTFLLKASPQSVVFEVQGAGMRSMEVTLFDLRGMPIWQGSSRNSRLAWNLRREGGQQAANGVYLYLLTVYDPDGRAHSLVGKLVLVR